MARCSISLLGTMRIILDGSPLQGLESAKVRALLAYLAAGWMETCTPSEIAEEIERSLDFLSSSWSDAPERQRSMRATLDHSWRLLSVDERQAFQNLSVFQGAFTRQAAEQVAGVSSVGLRRLADKSLLYAHPTGYHMHDLLRQYGAEKLAEDPAQASLVRCAHSTYYLEHAAGCEVHLKSPRRSKTLLELDAKINDLQAAWKWACQQGQTSLLARSLAGLCLYYSMRMRYQEGIHAGMPTLSEVRWRRIGLPCPPTSKRRLTPQRNYMILSVLFLRYWHCSRSTL